MPRIPTKSILDSLKGKIWFSVSGLAVLNCVVGVGVYLLASRLVTDAFFSIILSFVVSAFLTMVFGWWLANVVLEPLTKLTLAVKSLERSPTASLPRTTGSLETDELLDSINRTSSQINGLIGSMDEISAGRISSLKSTPKPSDRLSISFQNMIAKVGDSVNARSKLDEFEKEVADISGRLIRLRDGDLSVEIRTEFAAARGLTESVNFIASNLRGLSGSIYASSKATKDAAAAIRDSLRRVISDDDAKAGRTKLVAGTLAEMPERIHRVSSEIDEAFGRAGTIRKMADDRRKFTDALSIELNSLRKKLNDALRRVETLREQSSVLPNSARQATDVSRRSNMLAINLSVKTNGSNGSGHLLLASDEIGALSKKSADIAKAAGHAGTSFQRELNALEEFIESLRTDLGVIADKTAAESDNRSEFETGLDRLFELRERLPALLPGLDSEHESSLAFLEESAGAVGSLLREAEEEVAKIERLSSELMDSTGNFRQADRTSNPHLEETNAAKPPGRFANIDTAETDPAATT